MVSTRPPSPPPIKFATSRPCEWASPWIPPQSYTWSFKWLTESSWKDFACKFLRITVRISLEAFRNIGDKSHAHLELDTQRRPAALDERSRAATRGFTTVFAARLAGRHLAGATAGAASSRPRS